MTVASQKETVWTTVQTPQFIQIVSALENAKLSGRTKLLIGSTGVGKTYAINRFMKVHSLHTYRITVSNDHKLQDIIDELFILLRSPSDPFNTTVMRTLSRKAQIDRIAIALTRIKFDGGKPILIFDEGENMGMTMLKTLKGLYDRLERQCSIVLIGTERLVDKMLNLKARQNSTRETLPELFSRFKAGLRYIKPITPDLFKPFFELHVSDPGLRRLITETVTNYRELYDLLEPVMRQAQETGEPLTERLYRLFNEVEQDY